MDGNYWTRGRVSRRSMLRGAAVGTAGVAGAVLIGCGDSDDDPTSTPAPGGTTTPDGTAAASATTAPDSGAPKRGGKLTLHMGTEPRSLDPHFETFTPAPANATSNNLVRFTSDLTTIVPDAANLPEQPDETTYTFKLQPGIHMHDVDPLGGRPLTSEDVKYTIERQTNQAGDETGTYQHAYYFKDRIANIETPDDETITFTTSEPYAPFMNYMASPWSPIIAREYVEANGDLTEYVGASGPYILDEWQKEVRMTFKANPNYWKNPDLPYVDELEFLISPDPDTAASQFSTGAFNAYVAPTSTLRDRVQDSRGDDTRYKAAPSQFWRQFRMSPTDAEFSYLDYAGSDNETGAIFDDIRVRQAICQAINKQQVLDLVYSGDGQITFGPILPQFTNWALTEELVPFDLAESQKLMAAAGVEEIRGPMMWASSSPQSDQIGEIIKENLSEIGVVTDLEPMETAAYYNVTYAYRYTFSHHVPLNSPEPDENLSSYFGENSTYFKHFNPDIFDLVRKQAVTVDFEERKQVVKEAQEKIVLDYPIRFMFTTNVHQFISNDLKDYEISLDRYDNYGVETAWLDA